MRIAIIGAGIVGVTSAHELALGGHEVSLFERRGSVAAEASFAHAGLVAPALVAPWQAQPSALDWLRHAAWLWRHRRSAQPPLQSANAAAMWQLAQFSRERLLGLVHAEALDIERRDGVMAVLRRDADLVRARPRLKLLAEWGARFELLDAERARHAEPGLNPDTRLRAAIHLPHDGVGNGRQFAQLAKAEAQRHGARLRFDTDVRQLVPGRPPRLVTAAAEEPFDALVLCAGAAAAGLLSPLGLRLPLLPVWGCSVTAPLRHHDGHPDPGPRAALFDVQHGVSISRLGQRVRVAGGARIGGPGTGFDEAVLRRLYRVLDDWFPGAADMPRAQHWKGARPMLPDGPPLVGVSGLPGVWLNLGHGDHGWALACGAARLLAELIAGRPAPLDMARLGVERLQRRG